MAPAQRVELLVTASTTPGARFTLRALRHAIDAMGVGTYATEDLLTVATTAETPAAATAVPASLRPIEPPGPAVARKRLVLTQSGMGMMGGMFGFLINGRSFDMSRVDLVSTVGEVEDWDIVNDTLMDHPIHIHGTQFQLVSRESRGQRGGGAVRGVARHGGRARRDDGDDPRAPGPRPASAWSTATSSSTRTRE